MTFSDLSEVIPGLYIGSNPEPEDPFVLGANVVVSLVSATSERSIPPNGVLVQWPIKDGPIPVPEVLDSLARFINRTLRLGATVYVHCEAGMNRSALVVGRVLMVTGMSGAEAVERVRERRLGSLSDEYANWLISHPIRAGEGSAPLPQAAHPPHG